MRSFKFVAALMLYAAVAQAQTIETDPQNQFLTPGMHTLGIHIGGRVLAEPLLPPMPAGAVSYVHEWPGVYFEAAFTGDTVILKFDDPANEYRLFIDDLPAIPLAQPGKAEVKIADLGNSKHHIRLEKVTESIGILGRFEGFYATAPDAAPPARTRQIEFIGDSDMTGYGVHSAKRACTQDEVRLLSDAQAAYPALVAKHFDADYQINAISGRGMVRNFDGIAPGQTIGAIYRSVLPDEDQSNKKLVYVNPDWRPQIIFIALGGNDFFTPLNPDESWNNNEALISGYIKGYEQFVRNLALRHPDAALLIAWHEPEMLTDAEKPHLLGDGYASILNTAHDAGFRMVDVVDLGESDLEATACDYHASVSDHQKRADVLDHYIEARPELWKSE